MRRDVLPDQMSPYVLDNRRVTANPMLEHLSTILDRFSQQRLVKAGLRRDMRCLEIGAGNGSIARWMAERVGFGGMVVATDIDPRHVVAGPRVKVLTHDIASDVPLPHTSYDLIHARLVLAHLPQRRKI